MAFIANREIWIWLATLTVLGIVLGIDNLFLISIPGCKLRENQLLRARQIGLSLPLLTLIPLLFLIALIVDQDKEK